MSCVFFLFAQAKERIIIVPGKLLMNNDISRLFWLSQAKSG